MKKSKLLVCVVLFILTSNIIAQEKYNLPPKTFYKKAKIGFKNFQSINVIELSINEDSIYYKAMNKFHSLDLDTINYIRIVEGSKAGTGALIGGASMLLISLASVIQVQSDPDYELKDNVGGIIALYTMGGALVGAIIGSASAKETSYYIHAKGN